MLKRKIYLHVGYPKAASTAFQDVLASAVPQLKNAGVCYPEQLMLTGSTKHEQLFRLIQQGDLAELFVAFQQIERESVNCHSIVLSTESIVNQLYNYPPAIWQQVFNQLKQLGDLELLLVRRDKTSFCKSYYKQAVINAPSAKMPIYATGLSFSEFVQLDDIKQLANSEQVVSDLTELSLAPVTVFNYSKTVVADMLTHCNINVIEQTNAPEANVSQSAEVVEFIRQINRQAVNIKVRNAWFLLIQRSVGFSSATASILASRANEPDLQALELSVIDNITLDDNRDFGIDTAKFSTLLQQLKEKLLEIKYSVSLM